MIELEAVKWNGNQMPSRTDKVSDSQDGKDVAIASAEDESVDHADCLALLVDTRSELHRIGTISLANLLCIEGRQAPLLRRGPPCRQQEEYDGGFQRWARMR